MVVNGRGVPQSPPPLGSAAVVEVWFVGVDDVVAAERCLPLLAPEDRARLGRLAPPLRHRHVCAHAAARLLACAAIPGESPARVLTRTVDGRLALAASAAPPDGRFDISLAHAGDAAAIAFSRCGAVGVDIEVVGALGESEERRLARYALAEPEFAQWCEAAAELRARLLTRAWTRKEAVLKALGLGLAGDVRSVATRLDPDVEAAAGTDRTQAVVRIDGFPGLAGAPSNWTLRDLPDEPGLIGSLAVRAPNVTVRYRRSGIFGLLERMDPGS
ncbi:4'-phosphopantetheinyl transferase family protein [Actinoplanes sp. NPDC049681]|uniref:4'-phosphopantetheinyl transferase family protein n=1 Tax=Actinoplanes sp. NPDC049681 TaxID=3363905 RepID=UPI0037B96D87